MAEIHQCEMDVVYNEHRVKKMSGRSVSLTSRRVTCWTLLRGTVLSIHRYASLIFREILFKKSTYMISFNLL